MYWFVDHVDLPFKNIYEIYQNHLKQVSDVSYAQSNAKMRPVQLL